MLKVRNFFLRRNMTKPVMEQIDNRHTARIENTLIFNHLLSRARILVGLIFI